MAQPTVLRSGRSERESFESRTTEFDGRTLTAGAAPDQRPEACARPATLSADDFRRRMRSTIRIASR